MVLCRDFLLIVIWSQLQLPPLSLPQTCCTLDTPMSEAVALLSRLGEGRGMRRGGGGEGRGMRRGRGRNRSPMSGLCVDCLPVGTDTKPPVLLVQVGRRKCKINGDPADQGNLPLHSVDSSIGLAIMKHNAQLQGLRKGRVGSGVL